jgi:hypothetical protein
MNKWRYLLHNLSRRTFAIVRDVLGASMEPYSASSEVHGPNETHRPHLYHGPLTRHFAPDDYL